MSKVPQNSRSWQNCIVAKGDRGRHFPCACYLLQLRHCDAFLQTVQVILIQQVTSCCYHWHCYLNHNSQHHVCLIDLEFSDVTLNSAFLFDLLQTCNIVTICLGNKQLNLACLLHFWLARPFAFDLIMMSWLFVTLLQFFDAFQSRPFLTKVEHGSRHVSSKAVQVILMQQVTSCNYTNFLGTRWRVGNTVATEQCMWARLVRGKSTSDSSVLTLSILKNVNI